MTKHLPATTPPAIHPLDPDQILGTPTPTPTSSQLADSFKRFTSAASELTSELSSKVTQKLEQSDTGKKMLDAGTKATAVAKDVYENSADTANKMLKNISGAEVQAQVVALAEQQRRYNDILATRLAEALARIETLEAQVKVLSDGC